MKTKFFYFLWALFVFSCSNDIDFVGENYPSATLELRGGNAKIAVCHYDSEIDKYKTLYLPEPAVKAHLKHGDELGECGDRNPVYLDENGVTVKCYDWAKVGDSGELGGITYTIVDESILREMVANGEDVTKVCTCKITDMKLLFSGRSEFDQNISSWDVSSVTDMRQMFFGATSFNQPLGKWDVSSVTDMRYMFELTPFNQPIGDWDVSKVEDMTSMFQDSDFNQDINKWDVSNVSVMFTMFLRADSFNQPIGDWDVSSVIDMGLMFADATTFNQDLGDWDVSNVTVCIQFADNTPQWTLPKPNFSNCDPGY